MQFHGLLLPMQALPSLIDELRSRQDSQAVQTVPGTGPITVRDSPFHRQPGQDLQTLSEASSFEQGTIRHCLLAHQNQNK